MNRPAGFSSLIGETAALIGDGIRGFWLFIVIVGGLEVAGAASLLAEPQGIGQFSWGITIDANAGPAKAAFQLVSAIVTIVGSCLLLAHFLEVRGRRRDRQTRILAYVGLTILSALGMAIGFILLVIPGIILAIRWSAASGFLLGEGMSVTDALAASWRATRGYSWPILGAAVVIFIGLIVGLGVLSGLAGSLSLPLALAIVSGLAGALVRAVFLAFAIAVYLLVRDDAGDASAVFA